MSTGNINIMTDIEGLNAKPLNNLRTCVYMYLDVVNQLSYSKYLGSFLIPLCRQILCIVDTRN